MLNTSALNSANPACLIVDLQTPCLSSAEVELLQQPCVSGVILFSRNIETPQQVARLAGQIKQLNPSLLLAVDQEGGRVQRLKEGFTLLPPLASLGKMYHADSKEGVLAAKLLGRLMASEVIAVGLDLSFAPVLDLDYATSEVIGNRAFSANFQAVIDLASAYIDGMHQAGMAATAKHFPGHGYVSADSHLELPIDQRSLADIEATCLKPFIALANKIEGVMPAHVVYNQVDIHPAGFSAQWLGYLRQQLNFGGIIFSDDLSMEGAASLGSYSQRAAAALTAGCNQLLVCNNAKAAVEVANYLNLNSFSSTTAPASFSLTQLLAKQNSAQASAWLATPEAKLSQNLALALVQEDYGQASTYLN